MKLKEDNEEVEKKNEAIEETKPEEAVESKEEK